jgi:secreted trypsin-like serine protease
MRFTIISLLFLCVTTVAFLGVAYAQNAVASLDVKSGGEKLRPYSRENRRILGGQNARIERAPWQVALVHKGKRPLETGGFFCGGSVVSRKWILTASHCVFSKDDKLVAANTIDVVFGTDDLGNEVGRVSLARIIAHPQYDATGANGEDHDIALLEMSASVPEEMSIAITSPAQEAFIYIPGESATVFGWGITESGSISQKLKAVEVRFVERNKCNEPQSYNGQITENMICAGDKDKDSCSGDSGGPLVRTDSSALPRQVGVVSFGYKCALENFPGVYTRVANYAAWIRQYASDATDTPRIAPSLQWSPAMRVLMTRKIEQDKAFAKLLAGTLSNTEFEKAKYKIGQQKFIR